MSRDTVGGMETRQLHEHDETTQTACSPLFVVVCGVVTWLNGIILGAVLF